MSKVTCILLTLAFLVTQLPGKAQSKIDSVSPKISNRYLDDINKQAASLEDKLDKKTAKVLDNLRKQEQKIFQKLNKTDSSKAKQMAADAKAHYEMLALRLQQKASKVEKYIPSLDSLGSSLAFLKDNPGFLSNAKDIQERVGLAMGKMNGLQNQFQKAEDVKHFIQQRKQYFKEQLQNLGFAKQLKQLNKEAYYYAAQVNEYKELLKDKSKATKKGLELLSKTKPFKDFMRKHSQLAQLFSLPDPDNPGLANLQGLQTRLQVTNLIQTQLGGGGPAAQAQFTQNLQDAQAQLNQMKEKLIKLPNSSGSSDDIMPEGFKPNNQKTKSFLQRIEFGTNIQSQRSNSLLPVTTDIGLNAGYKMNDKSVVGFGASYKLGWGESIRNIKLTQQGMGLRSFIDWKIKGHFWVTGGYEWNYRPALQGQSITDTWGAIQTLKSWQQSGLLGVSKQISLKTKILKQTKVQLLWDLLSYQQVPRTQPIIFRVGYGFK